MSSFERTMNEILLAHPDASSRIAALLAYLGERCPHAVWEDMASLDYAGDVERMQRWIEGQLPIRGDVQVLWFAMGDETTTFDLRGSSVWSRDPDDWDWWYEDDFAGGTYQPPVLEQMHALARGVEDPDEEPTADDGVWELTDFCLTLGYVSVAAAQILGMCDAGSVLGDRSELWVVSGHPDMLYGIILGRLTLRGFEPFGRS
jgi:hypothetical protein